MITDARALRPDTVPQDLHHRDGQIDHLSSVLAPSQLSYAEDVCIFGPSGTGKTTIAKYTLGQLEREDLGVRWAYVNGMSDNTTAAVMHTIVRDVGLGADLRREGSAPSACLIRTCLGTSRASEGGLIDDHAPLSKCYSPTSLIDSMMFCSVGAAR
jgi:Cdc6-like AAA superfamily ATPase